VRGRGLALPADGPWLYSNISIFDVDSNDALHEVLWTLPLFPFMQVEVTPLARHPSAIEAG
jgi:muconolactone D-isomerase